MNQQFLPLNYWQKLTGSSLPVTLTASIFFYYSEFSSQKYSPLLDNVTSNSNNNNHILMPGPFISAENLARECLASKYRPRSHVWESFPAFNTPPSPALPLLSSLLSANPILLNWSVIQEYYISYFIYGKDHCKDIYPHFVLPNMHLKRNGPERKYKNCRLFSALIIHTIGSFFVSRIDTRYPISYWVSIPGWLTSG